MAFRSAGQPTEAGHRSGAGLLGMFPVCIADQPARLTQCGEDMPDLDDIHLETDLSKYADIGRETGPTGKPVKTNSHPLALMNGKAGAFIMSDKGALVKGSIENAGLFLEHHPEIMGRLQFNAFTIQANVTRPFPWDTLSQSAYPRELTDSDAVNFCRWLERNGQQGVTKDKAFGVLGAVAEANWCHPLQDYLELLQWDNRPRIDNWLSYYLGAESNEYTKAVGKRFLIGAVARALRPGSKMDTMLIFEGPQGIGKSTAARVLFSDQYFTDSLSPIGSKDAAQELGGKWCVEIAELAQFFRTDQRHIKEMLSKTSDRFRPPYGRVPREYPRSCVFIGTYNPSGSAPLKDETGGRRFWPVRCGSVDLDALLEDRDQIWAEAVAAFKAGEPWWLQGQENELAIIEQENRQESDPWEDATTHYVAGRTQVTASEIMEHALGVKIGDQTRADEMRVGSIMFKGGWLKRRVLVDGKRKWAWVSPTMLEVGQ